jgi:cyclase
VGTAAHTTSDSIIHILDRSVVITGNLLFNGGTPFAPQARSAAGSRCCRP